MSADGSAARGPRAWLWPATAWALALLLAHALGYRMQTPWEYWQLLDREALRDHPWTSLWLLHAQPPGLNALAALLAWLADATGLAFDTLTGLVFDALGLVASVCFFDLARRTTGSRGLALAALCVLLADPGFHHFEHFFFYPFPLLVLVLLLFRAAARYLAPEGAASPWPLVGWLGALVLTRSLYHPAWALSFLALAVLARRFALGDRAGTRAAALAAPVAAALALCCLWPAKNLVVFGRAVSSSWMGYYASLGIPVHDAELEAYFATGAVPAATSERLAGWARRFGAERVDVIASPTKSDGSRNWNHLLVLERDAPLYEAALRWRRAHPLAWVRQALVRYLGLTRPTYAHPYERGSFGPPAVVDGAWARAYEGLLFANLRPALERLARSPTLAASASVRGEPLPVTVFGALLQPLAVVLAAGVLWRRRRRWTAREGLVLLALHTLLWVLLACVLLTEEGNRVRFPTVPLVILLGFYAAQALVGGWRRRAHTRR